MRFLREKLKGTSLRTLGVFAGGNLFVMLLGGAAGLLQARWIEPGILGEFRKYGVLTSYLNIGLVVVHDGLSRQFPYLLGKGNNDGAWETAAAAKWWYLFLSWGFSIIFVGLTLDSVLKGDFRSAIGWGAQIPCIWVAIYGAYLGVMYRTSYDFKRLSYNNIVSNIIGFCALIMIKFWGYWGIAGRVFLQSTLGLYINRYYVPVKVKASFNIKIISNLAKISLPLSIPGYISTSCLSASLSLIVLNYCGQSGLGIYGLALTFQAMAMTFTASVQQIFITKLTYKFGETEDVITCLQYTKLPTLLSIMAATILALVLCLMISPFIRFFLPKYHEAIPVIRILAMQLPISAAGMPLLILHAALWYRSVIAVSLVRFLVCLVAVAILPKTLVIIAVCMVLGDFCALIVGFGILRSKW